MSKIGFVFLVSASAGCLAPAAYRTAHVLPQGRFDLDVSVSAEQLTTAAYEADEGTLKVPEFSENQIALFPQLAVHYGLGHDFEIGGRLMPSAASAEVDIKYRLIGSDDSRLHVALAPAFGARARVKSGFYLAHEEASIGGLQGTLPLIVTYDIVSRFWVTAAVFGTYTRFRQWEDDWPDIIDDMVYAGGALNVRWVFRNGFYLSPAIEARRSVWRNDRPDNAPEATVIIGSMALGLGPKLP